MTRSIIIEATEDSVVIHCVLDTMIVALLGAHNESTIAVAEIERIRKHMLSEATIELSREVRVVCPHGLQEGINCTVCDTDGGAEATGYKL